MDIIIPKLDELFLPDEERRQFVAFNNFYNLTRAAETEIKDFLIDFDHIYFKFTQENLALPDPVMAFMLLSSVNLPEKDAHLIMSTLKEVSFKNMKNTIKCIFGHSVTPSNIDKCTPQPEIKMESQVTLFTDRFRHGQF